ncbi:MAG: transglutaminase-like cysteine peptidase [Hyphomicrobiales bacterium]
MGKIKAAIVAVLALIMVPLQASAATPDIEKEYGATKPPIGYVRFCGQHPEACKGPSALFTTRLKLTPERWNMLYAVNTKVNTTIKPATDEELYGQPEYWTYPTTAGDCEDYLLLKQKMLVEAGVPASALLITVVLDERGEGHAVLTVAGDQGDFVLDNRRDDILLWKDTNYKFLKRQSQRDPKQWVSLDDSKTTASGVVASSPGN